MRTCSAPLYGLLWIAIVPALSSGEVTLSHRTYTSAAQSGEAGAARLVGSLGGLVMHKASGGAMVLVGGFWFPGLCQPSSVTEETDGEYQFALSQNYPNPFNPRTAVTFTVPGSAGTAFTRLDLFDVSGRLVRILANEQLSSGPHAAIWDGRDSEGRSMATGVYFARLRCGSHTDTKQLILLR